MPVILKRGNTHGLFHHLKAKHILEYEESQAFYTLSVFILLQCTRIRFIYIICSVPQKKL